MAVLSAADRRAMPAKSFAGPGRSFPIGDKTHAREAISGATRSEHAGNITASEEASIKAKARAKLGGKSDHPAHGDCPGGEACKSAMSKMDAGQMHRMAMDAHAGKFGPEAQQAAKEAMQSPAQEPDADDMPMKRSMFSGDNDEDDQAEAPPMAAGSMFSGGR